MTPEEELLFWKSLALYLADCHAATAEYDGTLKSVSKSRKHRFHSICKAAYESIKNHRVMYAGNYRFHDGDLYEKRVLKRLEEQL